jgi:hypothetical protein
MWMQNVGHFVLFWVSESLKIRFQLVRSAHTRDIERRADHVHGLLLVGRCGNVHSVEANWWVYRILPNNSG